MISDRVVRNLLESATNLQALCLHYCLGSLTLYSFQAKVPTLRILRLEWVTTWITNDDLTILTQNFNLVELSLSGCKLLDSSKFYFQGQICLNLWFCQLCFSCSWSKGSQDIISSGWPNLILLHLEVSTYATSILAVRVTSYLCFGVCIYRFHWKIKFLGYIICCWFNYCNLYDSKFCGGGKVVMCKLAISNIIASEAECPYLWSSMYSVS